MPTDVFSIASASDDACGYWSGGTYPPASAFSVWSGDTILYAYKELTGSYNNWVNVFRWDTSSIPDDATITAVTLDVYVSAKGDADGRNIDIEWYDYGGDAMVSGDHTHVISTPIGSKDITTFTTGAVNTITVTSDFTGINLSGYTGIRMAVSGGAPSGSNGIDVAGYADANQEARLNVTYTTGGGGGYWLVPA